MLADLAMGVGRFIPTLIIVMMIRSGCLRPRQGAIGVGPEAEPVKFR